MTMSLLLGFSVLLFFTTAQGLICNQCLSEYPENCRSAKPCTAQHGKCYTKTVYNDPEGRKLNHTTYGCVGTSSNNDCGVLYLIYNKTYIFTCCDTERCNGKTAPFPPPNCTNPSRRV